MFKARTLFYKTRLTNLQRLRLGRETQINVSDNYEHKYPHGDSMTVWVAELLLQLFPDTELAFLLLHELRHKVWELGEKIGLAQLNGDATVPQFQFSVCDDRYVVWTGRTGFMDCETGTDIDCLPCPALSTFSYNLTELYRRNFDRCSKIAAAQE